MVEYIGLSHEQKIYGKKNLLYSQMELLSALNHYQNYKKYRKYELSLKKSLKEKIYQTQEAISRLDSLLPKTKHERFGPPKITTTIQKKRSDMQSEIDEIKRKIAELQ